MFIIQVGNLSDHLFQNFPLLGLQLFFVALIGLISLHVGRLFFDRHGWSHRCAGALHLSLLLLGAWSIPHQQKSPQYCFLYDILLGCSGVTLTLTAARDFPHRYVRNSAGQSGTLSEKAMVTQPEMIEHAYYQFLNLWQALYLHHMAVLSKSNSNVSDNSLLDRVDGSVLLPIFPPEQWWALLVVSAPWWVRKRFPVHSFSDNWLKKQKGNKAATRLETILYRIKKWQYVFYKHVVLHGINLTLCVTPSDLVVQPSWRLFWLCLNTSYVMEFFLQSLVKTRYVLKQSTMLAWNRWLMLVSSLAAVSPVLAKVRWELCGASLLLNFTNRHHDVFNTMLVASLALIARNYLVQ